ncbi:MAG: hypothetical protein HZB79_01245 [Deltaproteobacteria bacterium]|nr:hypothetical protein [Deltaproteobacteria bacterium]
MKKKRKQHYNWHEKTPPSGVSMHEVLLLKHAAGSKVLSIIRNVLS